MKQLKRLPEFIRFVMVGVFATALHYGIYFLLQKFINVNIAYTLGYALSFIANFYLTAYFTLIPLYGNIGLWLAFLIFYIARSSFLLFFVPKLQQKVALA